MPDVYCPYCEAPIEINHDDGYGYDEDKMYEQECSECGKSFAFTTCISFDHEAFKADCLNGSPHNFKPMATCPKEATEMECGNCGKRRRPTEEEMRTIMNPPTKSGD